MAGWTDWPMVEQCHDASSQEQLGCSIGCDPGCDLLDRDAGFGLLNAGLGGPLCSPAPVQSVSRSLWLSSRPD